MAARISAIADSKNLLAITSTLIQATLSSDRGITMSELADTMQASKQTPYRYLKVLESMGLVGEKKIGKEAFHTVSLGRLLVLSDTHF